MQKVTGSTPVTSTIKAYFGESFFMRWIHSLFFGNYFYGICAIALAVEASLQQEVFVKQPLFYIALFAVTVSYYTVAYITESQPDKSNLRSVWYADHKRFVMLSQYLLTSFIVVYGSYFLWKNYPAVNRLSVDAWMVLAIFPLAGAFYYGLSSRRLGKFNLRSIGWIKPFIIGFAWAGMVTLYPALFCCIEEDIHYELTPVAIWLFVKNFMFITLLAILFDIKDYAVDHNRRLKTFVVKNGLRNTIFLIILPLCFIGAGSFLYYALIHYFSSGRIVMNLVPFASLILVAYSMHRRKSILYYLVIIDGLMLLKALCGSIGMLFF